MRQVRPTFGTSGASPCAPSASSFWSSASRACHGMGKVVAVPLAPTRCWCICTVVWKGFPNFTSMEKQTMEVIHTLQHIISMTVISST